jgi:hypothetical protein
MTVALPFHSQLDTGNDHQAALASPSAVGYGKDDPQMLPFLCMAFYSVFRVRTGVRLTFFVVDLPAFQYLPYLFFRDVAAVHPASGMAGKNKMMGMPVNRLFCLPSLSAPDKQHHKQYPCYYSEFHRILIF